MDPADAQHALSHQGALLGRHEEMIGVLSDNTTKNSDLAHQISLLSVQVSALAAATIPHD